MSIALFALSVAMVTAGLAGNYVCVKDKQALRSVIFDFLGFCGCYLAYIAGGLS